MAVIDEKLAHIIPISYWTTLGDLDELSSALIAGLEAGLTINQIKEVLVQTYAYAGFPRALNAISTFLQVVNQRKEAGISDPEGEESSAVTIADKNAYGAKVRETLTGPRPVAAYAQFVPVIDDFLKEHLFADLFSRDVLTYTQRELVTVSVLASLGNVRGQLKTHLTIFKGQGADSADLDAFQAQIAALDSQKGQAVAELLKEIGGD